jgi:uncharacterized protein with PIN domain
VDGDQQTLKFAADRMLGKLAKWLRIMGQDVIYGPHLTGYGLIRAARQEGRLILTRDGHLKQKQPPEFMFIASDHYREQLRQVVSTQEKFSLCPRCRRAYWPATHHEKMLAELERIAAQ